MKWHHMANLTKKSELVSQNLCNKVDALKLQKWHPRILLLFNWALLPTFDVCLCIWCDDHVREHMVGRCV